MNLSVAWQPVMNPNDACTFMLWQSARPRSSFPVRTKLALKKTLNVQRPTFTPRTFQNLDYRSGLVEATR
jgi:hypothetical protein